MSRYSFTALSSLDFEELTRDILQAAWNLTLEAFTSGRDQGIDLRHTHAAGNTIIQCKHYAGSGYAKLLSHLIKVELPKIRTLKPKRYVLVTSVGLSPANKDEIVEALAPFICSTADVIGSTDIENLLSLHPRVEISNFKLWFTSTAVHERVLHNAEHCHTDFAVDRIQRKLPLFVQNAAYPRAEKMLSEFRVVIISGVPGIGKTTLAEMLLYAHLERGYEPVVIQSDVAEGRRLFRRQKKQIFYFDDFLGQTFLGDRREYLGRNEDVATINFIEMIASSKSSRFILTTREHILQNAVQFSERFSQSQTILLRCMLELSDYSLSLKGRILYNHLYFSDLPPPYKETILEKEFYLDIIKHQNFNPRLVEWMSAFARVKNVPPPEYKAHVNQLLTSPETIWDHAYHGQLSHAAQRVLLVVYTMGFGSTLVQLEEAFLKLHSHMAAKHGPPIQPHDFRSALNELDGSFLVCHSGVWSFLNPSIRGFVGSVILRFPELASDLIESASSFHQVVTICLLARTHIGSPLVEKLQRNSERLAGCVKASATRPHPDDEVLQELKKKKVRTSANQPNLALARRLMNIADLLQSHEVASDAFARADEVRAEWDRVGQIHFQDAVLLLGELRALDWILGNGGDLTARNFVDYILRNLAGARANDWEQLTTLPNHAPGWTEDDEQAFERGLEDYLKTAVGAEQLNCQSFQDLERLQDSIAAISQTRDIDLSQLIAEIGDEQHRRFGARTIRTPKRTRDWAVEEPVDATADIVQMFDSLQLDL